MVKIITDSTCNISQEYLEANRDILHVLNLTVIIGSEIINECDITQSELFERVACSNKFPTSSQPAPGEVKMLLDEFKTAGHTAVGIYVSAGVSGTFNTSKQMMNEYPKGTFYAVDCRSGCSNQINLVEQAVTLARAGQSAAEIYETMANIAAKSHLYFLVDTLDYLKRGGRIGSGAAFFGSLFGIKPVLFVKNGKIEPLDKVRTQKRAMQRIVDELEQLQPIEWLGVSHNCAEDAAAKMTDLLKENFDVANITIVQNGAVIGLHAGPGCLAVCAVQK